MHNDCLGSLVANFKLVDKREDFPINFKITCLAWLIYDLPKLT